MRSLLVVVASVLLVAPALAQHGGVGLKGGLRLTDYTGGQVSLGMKPGWEAGVFGRLPLTAQVLLQVEGSYASLGDHTLTTDQVPIDDPLFGPVIEEERTSLQAAFVDVPVLVSVLLPAGEGERVWIRLGAGGMASVRAQCTIATRDRVLTPSGAIVSEAVQEADCPDGTAGATLSLLAGGGLDVHLGRVLVVADVRYAFGLTSVLPDDDGSFRGLALTAGVGVPF
jgi:hypothetical protein